jgi:ankyrin repeat protein
VLFTPVLTLDRFRWVACQIDALEDCLDYPTLRTALDSLPETLNETYARMIRAIPANRKETAFRILQFLTFSERPLRIEEVVDAIAVNVDGSPYFSPKNRMPEPQEITRYCSSLVVTVLTKKHLDEIIYEHVELQLSHFSVKEYLVSKQPDIGAAQDFHEATARASMARVCLAYLLHFDQVLPLKEVLSDFPFAEHCAMYWMSYAQGAGCEGRNLFDLVERFFCHQTSSYQLCYHLYRPDQPWHEELFYNGEPRYHYEPAPALYYAVFGGFKEVVELLLNKGANVNTHGGRFDNALYVASAGGHEAIVKLLLNKGANVNEHNIVDNDALYAASLGGHEAIVKLLLDKGADVNAQGNDSALQAASAGGHEAIVKLLLNKGADVNAQSILHKNALYAASRLGHEAIVKLLLTKGADVNAQGNDSALQAASAEGYEAIVKLLLNKGADVNAQGEDGSALRTASAQGHEAIVKLLLDKGADVNAQANNSSALQAASARGHEAIVKLLLNKGADVNAQGSNISALQAASAGGHEAIVKLLLNKGADVNAQSNFGSALCIASYNGHEAIVKLLLNKGADVNAQGNSGSALYLASYKDHEAIVKLLLDKGAVYVPTYSRRV